MKKIERIKRIGAILLILLLNINSFAAIVSDNDGSAFVTKAEFDALKKNFNKQIGDYNNSIDSKIDGSISSYLAGLRIANEIIQENLLKQIGDFCFYNSFDLDLPITKNEQSDAKWYYSGHRGTNDSKFTGGDGGGSLDGEAGVWLEYGLTSDPYLIGEINGKHQIFVAGAYQATSSGSISAYFTGAGVGMTECGTTMNHETWNYMDQDFLVNVNWNPMRTRYNMERFAGTKVVGTRLGVYTDDIYRLQQDEAVVEFGTWKEIAWKDSKRFSTTGAHTMYRFQPENMDLELSNLISYKASNILGFGVKVYGGIPLLKSNSRGTLKFRLQIKNSVISAKNVIAFSKTQFRNEDTLPSSTIDGFTGQTTDLIHNGEYDYSMTINKGETIFIKVNPDIGNVTFGVVGDVVVYDDGL